MKKAILSILLILALLALPAACESAIAAIDPPSAAQAEADGMTLPEPADGGALYLGAANVSQADKLYVAFTLSADGASVDGVTLFIKDMEFSYSPSAGSISTVSMSACTVTLSGPIPVSDDVGVSDTRLTGFSIDGDAASAVLSYTYHYQSGGFGDPFSASTFTTVDIPFDVAEVRFAKVD